MIKEINLARKTIQKINCARKMIQKINFARKMIQKINFARKTIQKINSTKNTWRLPLPKPPLSAHEATVSSDCKTNMKNMNMNEPLCALLPDEQPPVSAHRLHSQWQTGRNQLNIRKKNKI